MMNKMIRLGGALFLSAALVFSAFGLYKTHAAEAVLTDELCSLQVSAEATGFTELMTLPTEVDLYKVAEISKAGNYTPIAGFESLDFSELDETTSAAQWESLAADAKNLLTDAISPAHTLTLDNGMALAEDLLTGLYLVDANQILSDYYQYDFKPYLISLPNNYYYPKMEDDTWIYDLVGKNAIGLKAEKTDRYGDLVITKTLDAYNATIGGANFVFQIEAYKTDIDTQVKTHVYSNVVSMSFYDPGRDSITIEDIPAGAEVTVREVYSGASYKVTSNEAQTKVIYADGEDGSPVSVNFSNTYDYRLNGGCSIVNSFRYDNEKESWTHSAAEDSTP